MTKSTFSSKSRASLPKTGPKRQPGTTRAQVVCPEKHSIAYEGIVSKADIVQKSLIMVQQKVNLDVIDQQLW